MMLLKLTTWVYQHDNKYLQSGFTITLNSTMDTNDKYQSCCLLRECWHTWTQKNDAHFLTIYTTHSEIYNGLMLLWE